MLLISSKVSGLNHRILVYHNVGNKSLRLNVTAQFYT